MQSISTSARTQYFTIATAGHVDHGKTSVLRALTGIDPDRLKEEKLRQMTTDLGFAHLRLPGAADSGADLVVGFIDVPGHGKFLKNMLAGVGGIDMALLVVAADEGPMPQTIRHVKILSLLGVSQAIVVLSKVDLAEEERQEEAINKTEDLLKIYGIAICALVRVASPQGRGFDELKENLRRILSKADPREAQDTSASSFLPIDRVFSKSGYGVVVTGTLVRGAINVGDSVLIEPGGLKARVRGLETFGQQLQTARAGQRLAVNLALKEHKALARGQNVLGAPAAPSQTLIVELSRVGDLAAQKLDEILPGQKIRLYHGTAECAGTVRWAELQESRQGDVRVPVAQIALSEPIVAGPGDRYVLRYGDEGVAGGTILLNARPRWLTRPKTLALSQYCLNEDWQAAVRQFIESNAQKMVRQDSIECFLPQSVVAGVMSQMIAANALSRLGDYLVTERSKKELSQKLLDELKKRAQGADERDKDHHGGALEVLRGKVMPGMDRAAFQHLVRDLAEAAQVIRQGDKISLPGAIEAADAGSDRLLLHEKIMDILSQHLCIELDELARVCQSNRKSLTAALGELSKQDLASVVNYDYACSKATLDEAHEILAKIWQAKREISPSDFREALATSRKYAMAMLAYFDDHMVTRRVNNSRVLLKNPKRP